MTSVFDKPFAIHEGHVTSRHCFWAEAMQFANTLPKQTYMINLCENRYLFCLSLLAAAIRGQVCLLPPSNQHKVIENLLIDYPNAYIVSEDNPEIAGVLWFKAKTKTSENRIEGQLDWQHAKLIAFTSGSSGKPQPHAHSFETFRISAKMALGRLGLENQTFLMVCTTPAQHMYGLETSVFWPLFSDLILHDGRPFFSEDIREIVENSSWPAILVSTPTHLRHLTEVKAKWNNLAGIISATDTLSEKLARKTFQALGQSTKEIYGSTETLSFASRELLKNRCWQLYPGCHLHEDQSRHFRLEGAHLPESVLLQDRFKIKADTHFIVLGRNSDMIKIAGKRISLTELDNRLRDIDGMEDGFFFIQKNSLKENRLGAVVVSKLSSQTIISALRPYLDEVFLPRKIYFVPAIPRNRTGKLTNTCKTKLLKRVLKVARV